MQPLVERDNSLPGAMLADFAPLCGERGPAGG
jgi:hypothetical protein